MQKNAAFDLYSGMFTGEVAKSFDNQIVQAHQIMLVLGLEDVIIGRSFFL